MYSIVQRISTCMDDLTSISELGSGTCGQVYKMVHNPTGYVMAVKVNMIHTDYVGLSLLSDLFIYKKHVPFDFF